MSMPLANDTGTLTEESTGRSVPRTTLKGDFIWTLFGNGIYAVSQWAMLVLLAKLCKPEVVGTYSFAVAVATPLITFASFQLRVVQVTDSKGEHSFSDYLGFRLWSMAAALFVLAGICLGFRYAPSTSILIGMLGIALAIESVSDVYYGRMQFYGNMNSIAQSMMARGAISTIAIVIVVLLTSNVFLGVVSTILVRLAVLFFFDSQAPRSVPGVSLRPCDRVTRPCWILPTQKTLLATTFPIGMVSVLVALNSSIPRYFIEWSIGPRELGIFAALSFFQSSGNMIVSALGTAAFRRLAASAGDANMAGFLSLLGKLLAVGLCIGIAGIAVAAVAGKPILNIMFRHEYAERANLLTYLMVAATLGYLCQFVGTAVTAARIFAPQTALFIVVGSTLTVACYILVPRHGVMGAITAILIATVVQITGFCLLLWLHLKKRTLKSKNNTFEPFEALAAE